MRSIYLAVVLAVFVTGSASAQSVKQKAKIEQDIRRLDLAHADAVLRGDLNALDKLWTEDFKVNNPFNQIDRADRIRTGAVTYSSFIREPETEYLKLRSTLKPTKLRTDTAGFFAGNVHGYQNKVNSVASKPCYHVPIAGVLTFLNRDAFWGNRSYSAKFSLEIT